MIGHVRFVLMAAILLALAACNSAAGIDSVLTMSTPGGAHKYGDSDPVHDWPGGAPHRFPIHGVDVSKWQGDLDWNALKRADIRFAFIKATEGGDLLDDKFADNWRQAQRANIPRSGYHFLYFCTSARVQAQWFIRNVPRERGSLPHVLDAEWNPKSPSCKRRPPPHEVREKMKIFLDRLERHYGKRPIIYTTVDFHRENLTGHMEDEVYWLRSVAAHPSVTYPGRQWAFWQYTGTGRIPGAAGDIDINVFAGNARQWNEWLKRALR